MKRCRDCGREIIAGVLCRDCLGNLCQRVCVKLGIKSDDEEKGGT